MVLVREVLMRAGVEFELIVIDDDQKAIAYIDTLDRGARKEYLDLVLLDLNLPRSLRKSPDSQSIVSSRLTFSHP